MSDLQSTVRVRRTLSYDIPENGPGLLCFYPVAEGGWIRYEALEDRPLAIGRSPECELTLDDDEASRRHARLEPVDSGWQIVDLDSANGVSVNGSKVLRRPLQGDEIIRIGSTLLCYLVNGTAPRSTRHPVYTEGIVGGPRLEGVLGLLMMAARDDLTVLLTGETGTGKELAARRIHDGSPRADGPFVALNCAAIPAEIVESELFGHKKGAFTGAVEDKPGLIRQAAGGTLFLDEIGEMPAGVQAKLLRVLQDHRVRPVGASSDVEVDLRIVAATNRDMAQQVDEGAFRADLLARIGELEIGLPPLRERIEDVPLLVGHFLQEQGRELADVRVETLELLCCQRWPYNIRQLRSAVRRALVLAQGSRELTPEHFKGLRLAGTGADEEGAAPLQDPAAIDLDEALRRCRGDAEQAAQLLGISRSQLYRRAKQYGLSLQSYRKG